jgi:hypothetical protein
MAARHAVSAHRAMVLTLLSIWAALAQEEEIN